jgi:serine phosphatase RsbU (regulator of sigma subunit)
MVVLILYVALVRGSLLLRTAFLLLSSGIGVFVVGLTFAVASSDAGLALQLSRIAVCALPLAAAGAFVYVLALTRQLSRHRVLVIAALITGALPVVPSVVTEWVVGNTWLMPTGIRFFLCTWGALPSMAVLVFWLILGLVLLRVQLRSESDAVRRKKLRSSLWSLASFAFGLADLPLCYGHGWYPLSPFAVTLGAVLALRGLLADDLIHARSFDVRTPLVLVYGAAIFGMLWAIFSQIGPYFDRGWVVVVVVAAFVFSRAVVAVVQPWLHADRGQDSPLERALQRYAARVQLQRSAAGIAETTAEVVELAIGCAFTRLLVPALRDYSWSQVGSGPLEERQTPDPVLMGWMAENPVPLERDELQSLRLGRLREPLEQLFAAHGAALLVPLGMQEELIGLLVLGPLPRGRGARSDELRFITRLQTLMTSALLHLRMEGEIRARVDMVKQIELAATMQSGFLPPGSEQQVGRLEVCGVYVPASRCGGDWWAVYPLQGDRVLLLIGDVTGHGIAAAMVTAAAKGCVDVVYRTAEDDLGRVLSLLDATVRRVGAGRYHMTCFASLIDPGRGEVTFANAGHNLPYLCRRNPDGSWMVDVLAARGNPLGGELTAAFEFDRREITAGDVLVWYTDGIVDCMDAQRRPYGDRRLQRALRGALAASPGVRALRDSLVRGTIEYQGGAEREDDITLVVGRLQ